MPRRHLQNRWVSLAAQTHQSLIPALTGTPLPPGSSHAAAEAEVRQYHRPQICRCGSFKSLAQPSHPEWRAELYGALCLRAAATSSARDKGMASAESPSLQTLRALKAGLQVSPVSCEAFLAEIHGVEGAPLAAAAYCIAS